MGHVYLRGYEYNPIYRLNDPDYIQHVKLGSELSIGPVICRVASRLCDEIPSNCVLTHHHANIRQNEDVGTKNFSSKASKYWVAYAHTLQVATYHEGLHTRGCLVRSV